MTGFGVQFWHGKDHIPTAADIQAAIEQAGRRWLAISGQPPTHICLPLEAKPEMLKLWTLQVVSGHSQPGVVIVGRDGESPGA